MVTRERDARPSSCVLLISAKHGTRVPRIRAVDCLVGDEGGARAASTLKAIEVLSCQALIRLQEGQTQ